MTCLKVHDLSVFYRQKAVVKNVSFSVQKGELVALLGLNGSGKTTLMKGICSLLKTKGECVINDVSTKNTPVKQFQKQISYIPQRHNINFHISVLEIVLMGFTKDMALFENYSESQKQRSLEALRMVEMKELYQSDFLTLSEGQKQLVILARALVQDSELMIFDEPDSAMDFNNKHLILSKIKKTVTDQNCAILCLHDANFALKYCDRALLMKNGEVVFDLDINNADDSEIKTALSLIYNDIKIVDIEGQRMMTRI